MKDKLIDYIKTLKSRLAINEHNLNKEAGKMPKWKLKCGEIRLADLSIIIHELKELLVDINDN